MRSQGYEYEDYGTGARRCPFDRQTLNFRRNLLPPTSAGVMRQYKIWSRVPRDSEPRMSVLARISSNLPDRPTIISIEE
jgi:hypothetical protein